MIAESGNDFKIPVDEFDGKVVYGEKRKQTGNATISFKPFFPDI